MPQTWSASSPDPAGADRYRCCSSSSNNSRRKLPRQAAPGQRSTRLAARASRATAAAVTSPTATRPADAGLGLHGDQEVNLEPIFLLDSVLAAHHSLGDSQPAKATRPAMRASCFTDQSTHPFLRSIFSANNNRERSESLAFVSNQKRWLLHLQTPNRRWRPSPFPQALHGLRHIHQDSTQSSLLVVGTDQHWLLTLQLHTP